MSEEDVLVVTCPVCGKVTQKSIFTYSEVRCQRFRFWKQIKKSVLCQEPLVFLLLLITKNFSGNGSGTVRRNIGICFKITF